MENMEEEAAQHLLGLRELGRDLALLMPKELEPQVCSSLQEDQGRPLMNAMKDTPEADVSLGCTCLEMGRLTLQFSCQWILSCETSLASGRRTYG